MANERIIISRVMNKDFVIVLYKRLGIPKVMNIQIYINKVDLLRDNFNNIMDEICGVVDYFGECNGNNDFLFENFRKWKYLIKAHFEDKQINYITVIRNLKNLIIKELEDIEYNKQHRLDDKYVINFK